MANKKHLQRLEGLARRAMQTYGMVQPGDKIAVGVSGGKDSVALLLALHNLSFYYEHSFSVHALMLDPFFGGKKTDYSALLQVFAEKEIPYTVVPTNIGSLVFDVRKEPNPCALCAKLRRGTLHTQAKLLSCNKVALGHHLDDAVETFYMNLFGEGRLGCFSPVTWLSQKEITVIRPLVLATEQEVAKAAAESGAPIVKSLCPADGKTQRTRTKEFVAQQMQKDPAFCKKTLAAMQTAKLNGWGTENNA